jgi:hypothetical protein
VTPDEVTQGCGKFGRSGCQRDMDQIHPSNLLPLPPVRPGIGPGPLRPWPVRS